MSFFSIVDKISEIQSAVCTVVKDKYSMRKGTETYTLDSDDSFSWYDLAVKLGHIEEGVSENAFKFVRSDNGSLVDPDATAIKKVVVEIRQNADSKGC